MKPRVLMFSVLAMCLLLQSGCKPAATGLRALQKWSSKGAKAAPKILPGAGGGSKTLGPGLGAILSKSKTAGQRLTALQSKIPPHVYAHLFKEWQQNDAELRSVHRQLQDQTLSEDRRTRLESKAKAAADRLAEIERLTEEYG